MRPVDCWMRKLPQVDDEKQVQEFEKILVTDFGITLEKYVKECEENNCYPTNLSLTNMGIQEILKQERHLSLLKEKLSRMKQEESGAALSLQLASYNAITQNAYNNLNAPMLTTDEPLNDNENTIDITYYQKRELQNAEERNILDDTVNAAENLLYDIVRRVQHAGETGSMIEYQVLIKASRTEVRLRKVTPTVLTQNAINLSHPRYRQTDANDTWTSMVTNVLSSTTENTINNVGDTSDYHIVGSVKSFSLLFILSEAVHSPLHSKSSTIPSTETSSTVTSQYHPTTTINIVEKHSISENMKILCKKILVTSSPVLSATKLNRSITNSSMIDVHKGCKLLIR
ncbi:unnamed protein product [Didymodactylos carnosus]|uniref:Uncharacterized protein n=1 Tax=Didymodactylos carnosus TaxID=1234261 RepID=A0A813XBI3_9BILA|nr:unnamed protein product [Didymodactylos carnosus]CAF3655004.1 unnamed protein product [Didymodactylos carnosus]